MPLFRLRTDETQVSQSQVIRRAKSTFPSTARFKRFPSSRLIRPYSKLLSARQQVVAAQTDVDRAQVDLNVAERELKRNAELLEAELISRLEYDQKKDRVSTARVALRNAQARLKSQQLSVNEAEARVKESRQGQINRKLP